ncbi:hypothetical protein CHARACLAT_031651 [Characodon lateralis]|uniref:Immunoglobulin domain-containing protein n=1 Tax=Characodon lateralis TaxID=208331 RepID=A0ABU7F899_9TELE|nr:hypothetical protein [Characodon lateralis]
MDDADRVSVKIESGVLLLSAPSGSAVALSISPDLQQFFRDQSVKLTCEDQVDSDVLVVKRNRGGPSESCGAEFGRLSALSCFLPAHQTFSGSYWCEARTGDRSDPVSISVSDGGLILLIPALPVTTGSDVTLSCREKNKGIVSAYFFFNGSHLGSEPKPELLLHKVQPSDGGSYWCSTDEFGSSPQGLLRVRDPPSTTSCTTTETFRSPPEVQNTSLSPPFTSTPVIVAVGSLVPLLLVVLAVTLGPWRKQQGRRQLFLPGEATSTHVIFRPSANKIPPRRSHGCPVQSEKTLCRYTCGPAEAF